MKIINTTSLEISKLISELVELETVYSWKGDELIINDETTSDTLVPAYTLNEILSPMVLGVLNQKLELYKDVDFYEDDIEESAYVSCKTKSQIIAWEYFNGGMNAVDQYLRTLFIKHGKSTV